MGRMRQLQTWVCSVRRGTAVVLLTLLVAIIAAAAVQLLQATP